MSLRALTPLKAVRGHGQPLLIVVKRLFCNVEYKLDAAVEGKWLPQGVLKAVSKGQVIFMIGTEWFTGWRI